MSDFGGTIGLWVGATFITAVELLDLVISLFLICCWAPRRVPRQPAWNMHGAPPNWPAHGRVFPQGIRPRYPESISSDPPPPPPPRRTWCGRGGQKQRARCPLCRCWNKQTFSFEDIWKRMWLETFARGTNHMGIRWAEVFFTVFVFLCRGTLCSWHWLSLMVSVFSLIETNCSGYRAEWKQW